MQALGLLQALLSPNAVSGMGALFGASGLNADTSATLPQDGSAAVTTFSNLLYQAQQSGNLQASELPQGTLELMQATANSGETEAIHNALSAQLSDNSIFAAEESVFQSAMNIGKSLDDKNNNSIAADEMESMASYLAQQQQLLEQQVEKKQTLAEWFATQDMQAKASLEAAQTNASLAKGQTTLNAQKADQQNVRTALNTKIGTEVTQAAAQDKAIAQDLAQQTAVKEHAKMTAQEEQMLAAARKFASLDAKTTAESSSNAAKVLATPQAGRNSANADGLTQSRNDIQFTSFKDVAAQQSGTVTQDAVMSKTQAQANGAQSHQSQIADTNTNNKMDSAANSNLQFTQLLQETQQQFGTQKTNHAPQQNNQPSAAEQVAMKFEQALQTGQQKITLQLQPHSLGKVDVELNITRQGETKVRIVAEKAETLDMLQRDSRTLERLVQDSGLKLNTGDLSFDLREQNSQEFAQNFGQKRPQNPSKFSLNNAENTPLGEISTNTRVYESDALLDITI